jgi:predicted nucleic acid-binding protein
MGTLVDTSILLRAFDANSEHYRAIRRAFRRALEEKIRLVVTVQNLAEFWNVATRPFDKNGQGLSVERVKRRIEIIERFSEIVSEDNVSYQNWKRLVEQYGVQGVKVHDARLVSIMLRSALQQILTLNDADFERYKPEGIIALTPEQFLRDAIA